MKKNTLYAGSLILFLTSIYWGFLLGHSDAMCSAITGATVLATIGKAQAD